MGAVVNMRPDLFKAVIARVPFVDVINTMLDESLPLTVGEFEEWGNPKIKEQYDYMKSYSPYDNLAAKAYPAMLVKTSFDDSQVMYWEPAKYVARLRAGQDRQEPAALQDQHGGRPRRLVGPLRPAPRDGLRLRVPVQDTRSFLGAGSRRHGRRLASAVLDRRARRGGARPGGRGGRAAPPPPPRPPPPPNPPREPPTPGAHPRPQRPFSGRTPGGEPAPTAPPPSPPPGGGPPPRAGARSPEPPSVGSYETRGAAGRPAPRWTGYCYVWSRSYGRKISQTTDARCDDLAGAAPPDAGGHRARRLRIARPPAPPAETRSLCPRSPARPTCPSRRTAGGFSTSSRTRRFGSRRSRTAHPRRSSSSRTRTSASTIRSGLRTAAGCSSTGSGRRAATSG